MMFVSLFQGNQVSPWNPTASLPVLPARVRPRPVIYRIAGALLCLLLTGPAASAQKHSVSSPHSIAPSTLSTSQLAHLVQANGVKFAPALRTQLLRATGSDSTVHASDHATRSAELVTPLLPVIVQTDGTVPTLVRPLFDKETVNSVGSGAVRTSLLAFHSHRQTVPAIGNLNTRGTLVARLSATDLIRLATDEHVRHISPDLPIKTCDSGGPTYYDYAIQAIGADYALVTNNLTGSGVTVAVVDTGIYPHPDLTTPMQRITGWQDLVNGLGSPYDDNGHGTHVAGIVAGNGTLSQQNGYNASLVRTASGANLVGVKVLDQTGGGTVSNVIAGIDWCVAQQSALHIKVLNLSIGHPIGESYTTDPLCQACERAWAAGITVVCAAGNLGRTVPDDQNSAPQYGSITSPGNDPHVITVGAMNTAGTLTRSDDLICSYSSRGPSQIDLTLKPDLVAPGNFIISLAVPGSTLYAEAGSNLLAPAGFGGTGSPGYMVLSGTSMAAPAVAGAAALLLQADPTLTPDTIKARLMLSATKTDQIDYLSYGAGYLNIPGALVLTQVAASATLSPQMVLNSDGTASVTNFAWGGNIIKGLNFGWGGDLPPVKTSFAWNGDAAGATNFGWGGDLPPVKTGIAFLTPQTYAWNDTSFYGNSLYGGPVQLPQNFSNAPSGLWSGQVSTLAIPNYADSLALQLHGD